MTSQQEWNSWKTPSAVKISHVPEVGSKAPSSSDLIIPSPNGKPIIVTFLRHCGCPFAEKTFKELCDHAKKIKDVEFIAVSHSTVESTDKWIISVGGELDTKVIVDSERKLYGDWGLGISNAWHVLSPISLYSVWKLGKQERIWNRPTESGNRWQKSGSFAIDKDGIVRWGGPAKSADDIPDFGEALMVLGIDG